MKSNDFSLDRNGEFHGELTVNAFIQNINKINKAQTGKQAFIYYNYNEMIG